MVRNGREQAHGQAHLRTFGKLERWARKTLRPIWPKLPPSWPNKTYDCDLRRARKAGRR